MTLEELFKGRIDLETVKARLMLAAREEGLPFGARDKTYNSRLARNWQMGRVQRQRENDHDAVFRAYFAEGRNIGKLSELLALARALGLPEEEARKVLEEDLSKTLWMPTGNAPTGWGYKRYPRS